MPAFIPSMRSAGIKWVSGYPENFKRGLPYISGLMIMNDAETGIPYAVMDCAWITAMRTGAASALSAKYLARPDSRAVGILACGVQGHTNLEALACLFPIKRVYAYDVLPQVQEKFVADMKSDCVAKFVSTLCTFVQLMKLVVASTKPARPTGTFIAYSRFVPPSESMPLIRTGEIIR